MKGYMYILECSDESYYIGSTKDLTKRLKQHQNGEGANYTKNRLPVKLIYVEEFNRIDKAFYREKQIQKWSRAKKEALVKNNPELLHTLSECKNESHYRNAPGNRVDFNSTTLDTALCNIADLDSAANDTAAFGSAQAAVGSAQAAVGSAQAAVGSTQAAVGSVQAAVGSAQAAVGSAQAAGDSESEVEKSDLET